MDCKPLVALGLIFGLACGGKQDSPVVVSTDQPHTEVVPTEQPYTDLQNYSDAHDASLSKATEGAAITHHQVQVGGKTLAFTAKAGHLTILDPQTQTAAASMFYVAYSLDGQAAPTRPVTFFYNGGPGSAADLLHLGSFGPRRIVTGIPAMTETAFPLVDNQECALDLTDMVFINPVGTGFSQAITPHVNKDFWGVDVDAESIRDFILRYIEVNQRQNSPKYLFGESYGTPRSAVLAHKLETVGVHLTGVILQSSILNYNSSPLFAPTLPFSNAPVFPTYAATGAFFKLTRPVPSDIPAYLSSMRTFTEHVYGPAVDGVIRRMALLPSDTALIPQLVDATGIPATIWGRTEQLDDPYNTLNFNLGPWDFMLNLVPGSLLGIYDGRMTAPESSTSDPSASFIDAPFKNAIKLYLRDYLKYQCDAPYVRLNSKLKKYWNYQHDGLDYPDTIPDLAAAITANPALRVFAANGCYDLITPFYQTELDLRRIASLPIASKVSCRTYLGGHMTYLDDQARKNELADLKAFYSGTLPTDVLPAPRATLVRSEGVQGAPQRQVIPVQREAGQEADRLLFGPFPPQGIRGIGQKTPPSTGSELQAQVARKRAEGSRR